MLYLQTDQGGDLNTGLWGFDMPKAFVIRANISDALGWMSGMFYSWTTEYGVNKWCSHEEDACLFYSICDVWSFIYDHLGSIADQVSVYAIY